jgi:hypothetical protein
MTDSNIFLKLCLKQIFDINTKKEQLFHVTLCFSDEFIIFVKKGFNANNRYQKRS